MFAHLSNKPFLSSLLMFPDHVYFILWKQSPVGYIKIFPQLIIIHADIMRTCPQIFCKNPQPPKPAEFSGPSNLVFLGKLAFTLVEAGRILLRRV